MAQKTLLRLVENKVEAPSEVARRSIVPNHGDFWKRERREMHSLHYVSTYPNSFKPELVDFCIRRYSEKGQVVFDPFCGRGTTPLQAILLGRIGFACDANPLAIKLTMAKLNPVGLHDVVLRLNQIALNHPVGLLGYQENFSPFYHVDTYRELVNLRTFLRQNKDQINSFIELLALSRLHGHAHGFFSRYSFPDVSLRPEAQLNLNQKRRQNHEYRAIVPRLIRKAAEALKDGFTAEFFDLSINGKVQLGDARALTAFSSNSVDLIVTSPPLIQDITRDYVSEHWLEFWFTGISRGDYQRSIMHPINEKEWRLSMRPSLQEMLRVMKPYAYAIFDIGEVEVSGVRVSYDSLLVEELEQSANSEKSLVLEEILVNQKQLPLLSHHTVSYPNRRFRDSVIKGKNNPSSTSHRLVALKCLPRTSRFRGPRL